MAFDLAFLFFVPSVHHLDHFPFKNKKKKKKKKKSRNPAQLFLHSQGSQMDFNQARITPQMWIPVLSRLLLFGNEQVIYSLDEETEKKNVIAFLSALQKIQGEWLICRYIYLE